MPAMDEVGNNSRFTTPGGHNMN